MMMRMLDNLNTLSNGRNNDNNKYVFVEAAKGLFSSSIQ